jgi:hypothetical protein
VKTETELLKTQIVVVRQISSMGDCVGINVMVLHMLQCLKFNASEAIM